LLRDEKVADEIAATLREARDEFSEDRFVAGLGKFREALSSSRANAALAQTVREAAAGEVARLMPGNWRVAEVLLFEVEQMSGQSAVLNELWANIEHQKRQDIVQLALDESGRAEQTGYLPHVRSRLLQLAQRYPGEAGLAAQLHVLERLIAQRVADDRDENLGRLALFCDRLDETENPETLHGFRTLVAPFVDAYEGDPDFGIILDDVSALGAAYESAAALLSEERCRESLDVCDAVLARRPRNVLFRRLAEKAKGREWVRLLADSCAQRAREFEDRGRYGEAMEEWEALRAIDPHYPGLESEAIRCAGLKAQQVQQVDSEPAPHFVESDLQPEPSPSYVSLARSGSLPLGLRIAITQEAWNYLKTGLAATVALLLVMLVLASNLRR
jgi:hypothetical protein